MLLGVDVGGTAVKIGTVSPEGELLSFETIPLRREGTQNPMFETAMAEMTRVMENTGGSITGIGISATGQVDPELGRVIGAEDSESAYIGSDFQVEAERRFHLPVAVLNDADAALLGECAAGAAQGVRDVLMITIGTGIGGAFTVGGKPFLGHRGIAGELGHTALYQDGPRCVCGRRGCYQNYASAEALVRRAERETGQSFRNAREVFETLDGGGASPALRQAFEGWTEDIAAGLTSFVHLLNPEMVVIGGGVSEQPMLIESLRGMVLRSLMPRFRETLRIEKAVLGNRAGVIGAVRFLLDRYPELFPT